MPRLLDPDLIRVARHRQISIKTARDWRDSDNHKWHSALSEIGYRPAVDVPAVPIPSGGFFTDGNKADTASTATDPLLSDPFAGVKMVCPLGDRDPFEGISLADLSKTIPS